MNRLSRHILLLLFIALPLFTACGQQVCCTESDSSWSADSAWYQSKDSISQDKIDLIYLVSTNIISATDTNGQVAYRAQLTTADRQVLDQEFAYVEENIGRHDFNFISPYYHQFTFDAINLSSDQFDAEYKLVSKEVCESFDYYMKHKNQGRKFALIGFSQGGMLLLDVLRHMTDEQYSKMVAAYAIGYRISAEDVKCKHIVPATDESTQGVTISYNSALSNEGIWPSVAGDAITSINPVNWKTDSTPATFSYEGSLHTVHLDPTTHLLIVETDKADDYRKWTSNPVFQSAHVNLDCLHHWDLLFYTKFIHDNILKRASQSKQYRE